MRYGESIVMGKPRKASKAKDEELETVRQSKTPMERIFEECVGREMTPEEKRILEIEFIVKLKKRS